MSAATMFGRSSDAGDAQCSGHFKAWTAAEAGFCSFQASSLLSASLQEQSGYDKKTFMGYIKVSQVSNLTVVMLCSSATAASACVSLGKASVHRVAAADAACFLCSPGWTRY